MLGQFLFVAAVHQKELSQGESVAPDTASKVAHGDVAESAKPRGVVGGNVQTGSLLQSDLGEEHARGKITEFWLCLGSKSALSENDASHLRRNTSVAQRGYGLNHVVGRSVGRKAVE